MCNIHWICSLFINKLCIFLTSCSASRSTRLTHPLQAPFILVNRGWKYFSYARVASLQALHATWTCTIDKIFSCTYVASLIMFILEIWIISTWCGVIWFTPTAIWSSRIWNFDARTNISLSAKSREKIFLHDAIITITWSCFTVVNTIAKDCIHKRINKAKVSQ